MSIMKTVTGAKFDDIKGDITNLRADFSKQSDGNIFFVFKLLSNEIDPSETFFLQLPKKI